MAASTAGDSLHPLRGEAVEREGELGPGVVLAEDHHLLLLGLLLLLPLQLLLLVLDLHLFLNHLEPFLSLLQVNKTLANML